MQDFYYSHGKLLITGEYLVLKGAKSLAMPVAFGQSLEVFDEGNGEDITWESREVIGEDDLRNTDGNPNIGDLWFNAKIKPTDWTFSECSNEQSGDYLIKALKALSLFNPEIGHQLNNKKLVSKVNFDLNWGLGSSSTLISNLAYLANIDPFDLHFAISNGSGYDVACARNQSAILYQMDRPRPKVQEVCFDPAFNEQLFFLYLGQKQNSASSVSNFNKKGNDFEKESAQVSDISKEILGCSDLRDFNYLIREHENIISSVLGVKSIKSDFFSNFDGQVKSLGAWGGDFALVSTELDYERVNTYFKAKGLDTIIPFNEMKLGANGDLIGNRARCLH